MGSQGLIPPHKTAMARFFHQWHTPGQKGREIFRQVIPYFPKIGSSQSFSTTWILEKLPIIREYTIQLIRNQNALN